MPNKDTYQLFMDGLDVINRSLDENRDKGVYGKLIAAFDKFVDGHVAAAGVYQDDPKTPHDFFTIRYLKGRFELVERGKGEHDTEWKVSTEYLQSLVDDPQKYIDHPARLDLEWLKHILPDSASSLFSKAA